MPSFSSDAASYTIENQETIERIREAIENYQTHTVSFNVEGTMGPTDERQTITEPFEIDTDRILAKYAARSSTQNNEIFTRNCKLMDFPEIELWLLNEALSDFAPGRIESLIDDGGYPAIRHEWLAVHSEDITAHAEHNNLIAAFNEVSMEWPYQARAYLAAYEAEHADRGNEDYESQCREFAEAENVMGYQTHLDTDWWCGDNPYRCDDLSEKEAEAALLLHADGEDPQLVEDAANPESFIEWYNRTGDVERSLRGSRFDGDIREEVAGVLAEPESWPAELDPQNIHQENCIRCGIPLYEVCHHEDGHTYVNHHGDVEPETIHTAESDEIHAQSSSDGLVCGGCAEFAAGNMVAVYYDGDIARIGQSGDGAIFRDWGANEDNPDIPHSRLPSEINDQMRELLDSSTPETEHLFAVQPTDTISPSIGAQQQLLSDLLYAENERELTGPIFVYDGSGPDGAALCMPRREPSAAREGKELLENAETEIAT